MIKRWIPVLDGVLKGSQYNIKHHILTRSCLYAHAHCGQMIPWCSMPIVCPCPRPLRHKINKKFHYNHRNHNFASHVTNIYRGLIIFHACRRCKKVGGAGHGKFKLYSCKVHKYRDVLGHASPDIYFAKLVTLGEGSGSYLATGSGQTSIVLWSIWKHVDTSLFIDHTNAAKHV